MRKRLMLKNSVSAITITLSGVVLMSCDHNIESNLGNVFQTPPAIGTPSQSEETESNDYMDDFNVPELNAPKVAILEPEFEIEDPINNKVWQYGVILPPSFYTNPEKKYPVLYLLHGLNTRYINWENALKTKEKYEYCLANNLIPEIVIVLPQALGTYYVDGYDGNVRYEQYFYDIFMPEVENKFRVDQDIKRNVAGFSMGGYGAAYYACKYPELYSYAYVMSGVMDGKGFSVTPPIIDLITDAEDKSELPYLTMDIGFDDDFYQMNLNFHNELNGLGIEHEYIEREGGHEWAFWSQGIYACLLRVGRRLQSGESAGVEMIPAD